MFRGNIKMAWSSIRSARWRSFLTMLGIIIGVISVVTIVSLGEGVKRQIANQASTIGKDVITVLPGQESHNGEGISLSGLAARNVQTLSDRDYSVIDQTKGVESTVPFSIVSGVASVDGTQYGGGTIFGTNQDMPVVLNQKVEFGAFFTEAEINRHVAVIGKTVAEQLFKENVPVGRTMTIRGQEYIVRGVLEPSKTSPLSILPDYNKSIFIPYPKAVEANGGTAPIYQIVAKPAKNTDFAAVRGQIEERLYFAHGQQDDVAVLSQEELTRSSNDALNLLTQLIAAVAAVSLLVGGIGIMNIMLVAVSERTVEIGIRKAIGATNSQILGQFLVEAVVLSFAGGIIGVILSIAVNFLLRILTTLQPAVSLPVILISVGVSVLVGVLFGVTPAIKAAHKHPIDSLRKI